MLLRAAEVHVVHLFKCAVGDWDPLMSQVEVKYRVSPNCRLSMCMGVMEGCQRDFSAS